MISIFTFYLLHPSSLLLVAFSFNISNHENSDSNDYYHMTDMIVMIILSD